MDEVIFPLKYEIQIDFCKKDKKFFLSTPISRVNSPSVRNYIESRKKLKFKPYATSFQVDRDIVHVVQEIPFQWGEQTRFRQQMAQFWSLVKKCHQILSEMTLEDIRNTLK